MGTKLYPSKKTLVFLGDSLTEFFDWQRRFPTYRVINLGTAGETVEALLGRMERVRSSIDRPDFIFLMTGINNIAMEDYDIIGPYKTILTELGSSFQGTAIVVQSILPVHLSWVDNRVIERTNVLLKEAAREFHTEYLDLYYLFVDHEGSPITEYLLEDGVHLSPRGYETWAKAVADFISTHLFFA